MYLTHVHRWKLAVNRLFHNVNKKAQLTETLGSPATKGALSKAMSFGVLSRFIFLLAMAVVPVAGQATSQSWHPANALKREKGVKPILVRTEQLSKNKHLLSYSLPDAELTKLTSKQLSALATSHATDEIQQITLSNAPLTMNEGEPRLPVVPCQFVIPAGQVIDKIDIIRKGAVTVPGRHVIEHGPAFVQLKPGEKESKAEPKKEIYDSDDAFPKGSYELVSVQKKRGVAIAIIRINPVEYRPKSGQLTYYKDIEVTISTRPEAAMLNNNNMKKRPKELNTYALGVENPDYIATYTNGSNSSDSPLNGGAAPLGICDPQQSYRYVIVTSAAVMNASTDYTVRDLLASKQAKGISGTIVTIEDILSDYSGVDQQEQLKNFIIDAYTNWETDYVLLGGDINIIPMRKLYCVAFPGGDVDHIPSDLYYQCLDGTFNNDNDDRWGEPTDGPGGTDIDLMSEVYIGRASAENEIEMSNFVYKTLAYEREQENAPYLRKALIAGEHLGFSGLSEYATEQMEEIRLGASTHGYTTAGFSSCNAFTSDVLYDAAGYSWPASELISRINSGSYSIINHLGHADFNSVMKLNISDADNFTNNNYLFAYSQGCIPGDFERDCIAEHMTTSNRHGMYAVVCNARFGWGTRNSTDGPSQRFARQFWDAYFGEFLFSFGELNADSHEENLWGINDECIRWCYYETNLFGDPQLELRGHPAGPSMKYISHTFDDGAGGNGDRVINPGETISISTALKNIGREAVTAVSGQLSTSDAFVTIVDNRSFYGDVSCCGGSVTSLDPFSIRIDPACPMPRSVELVLDITDASNNHWTESFSIAIYQSSQVSGHVRTLTGSNPVPNATIYIQGPMPDTIQTNNDGYYMFGGTNGTYTITAAADNYHTSEPISITLPPTVGNVDFYLGNPHLVVNPSFLQENAFTGERVTVPVSVANNGDLPLSYSIFPVYNTVQQISTIRKYSADHYVAIHKDSADKRIGNPVTLGQGGPDRFGYTWIDSDQPGGPVFTWNDIGKNGTTINLFDDESQRVGIGFNFPFYGQNYDSVYINANGFLQFGDSSSSLTNSPIPYAGAPNNIIAGFWDDLYPMYGGVSYKAIDSTLVIQFSGVPMWPNRFSNSFTFQMILRANGTIDLLYKEMAPLQLITATVGIENATGTDGLEVVYNASYIHDRLALRFIPAVRWLSVDKSEGILNPGESTVISASMDAVNLVGGTHTGALKILHNDSSQTSPASVPVTFQVTGQKRLAIETPSYDFGSVYTGGRKTVVCTLYNTGDEQTTITQIVSNNSLFSYNATLPLTVPAFGQVSLEVTFNPVQLGDQSGRLTVRSDAQDNPNLILYFSGAGTQPPLMQITPTAINRTVFSGEVVSSVVTIQNTGHDTLRYTIEKREPAYNLQILAWVPRTEMDTVYGNTIAAIDMFSDNFTVTNSVTFDSAVLEHELIGKDVFLVVAPQIESNIPEGTGTAFRGALERFTKRGGTIVVTCAGFGNTDKLITEAGLANVAYIGNLTHTELVIPDTAHVIMKGVEQPQYLKPLTAYLESYDSMTVVGKTYATYRDEIVVGEKMVQNGRLITIGPDYWAYNYGWARILSNAVETGRKEAHWINLSNTSGVLLPGQSTTTTVTLDTKEFVSGEYSAILRVKHTATNVASPLDIPISLTVQSIRRLSVEPRAIDFGTAFLNRSVTRRITVVNQGDVMTTITAIGSSGGEFAYPGTLPISIAPFMSKELNVTFAPSAIGARTGTLIITSNAVDNPSMGVNCTGQGVQSPTISITPASVALNVTARGSAQATVTLANTGSATSGALEFSVAKRSASMTAQILAWTVDVWGPEFDSVTNNLARYTRDYSITQTTTFDPAELGNALVGKDVLLLPRSNIYRDPGVYIPFRQVLQDFMRRGGSIIVIAAGSPSEKIMKETALMNFESRYGGSTGLLTVNEPDHPLMLGINPPLMMSYYTQAISVRDDARVLATDQNGNAVVSIKNLHRGQIVALGFSYGSRNDNWARILANAVELLRNNARWLTVNGDSGTLLPGQSAALNLAIDASAYVNGQYSAELLVSHNGSNMVSPVVVPLTITVTAAEIARNKPATASTSESGYPPSNVNDGNVTTRWSSAFSNPQWIRIDLGATYDISRVRLNWETASARVYRIEVSSNDTLWTPIFTENNGNGGIDDITLSGRGRYVRMFGVERTTQWGYSLYEFEVYGAIYTAEPPMLTRIETNPPALTIRHHGNWQFTARGFDQYGNSYPIETPKWRSNACGTIDSLTGFYMANCEGGPYYVTAEANGVIGRCEVTQTPGSLTSVIVKPSVTTITIGDSIKYSAWGIDLEGDTVVISPSWNANGGGIFNFSDVFRATTIGGPFTVTATVYNPALTGTATVTVTTQPELARIVISPVTAEVVQGQTRQFSAQGFDQFGNPIGSLTYGWNVSGGGTISSSGLFSAQTVGDSYTVTASSQGIIGTATVRVTQAPVLTSITVSPATAEVTRGLTRQFTAQGYDQFSNPMNSISYTWSVSSGGTISTSGLFNAATVGGPYTVSASAQGITGTASVTVIQESAPNIIKNGDFTSGLTNWTLENAMGGTAQAAVSNGQCAITITNGGSDVWHVQFRQGGVPLTQGKKYRFSFDARATGSRSIEAKLETDGTPWTNYGNIPATNLTTNMATYSYNFTMNNVTNPATRVVFNLGGSNASVTIDNVSLVEVVDQPVLTSIVVSPVTSSVVVGNTRQFTATGYDQYGAVYVISPSWLVSGGGTISSNGLFTAQAVGGPFTVSASAQGIRGTASVSVTQLPVLTTITVSPSTAEVVRGQNRQFSAQGYDQSGNLMNSITYAWSVTGGGTVSSNGLFTAQTIGGPYLISATALGISGTASVRVTDESVPNLIRNGDFTSALSYWTLQNAMGATAQVAVVNGQSVVTISNAGSDMWHIQFMQGGIPLTQGKKYRFSFDARATSSRSIEAKLETDGTPWTNYGNIPSTNITTNMATYSYTFTMNNVTNPATRVVFNLGNNSASVTIDNVKLVEISEPPVLTSIVVSPSTATVVVGTTQQFTATGYDQFGAVYAITPGWTVSGGGSISTSGLFTSQTVGGPYTISASAQGISGTASVTVTPEGGQNLFVNGNYSSGLTGWSVDNYEGASSQTSVINGQCVINIANGGAAAWNVQMKQGGIRLEQGRQYRFRFDAKAESSRSIQAHMETDGSPWTNYGNIPATNLTANMATYTYLFTMSSATVPAARVVFNVGGSSADVTIDNVIIEVVN